MPDAVPLIVLSPSIDVAAAAADVARTGRTQVATCLTHASAGRIRDVL